MEWASREYKLTVIVTVDAPHGVVETRADLGVVKYDHWDEVFTAEWRRDRWVWHRVEYDSDDDDRHAIEYRMGKMATVRYEYEPVVPLTAEDHADIAASLAASTARLRERFAAPKVPDQSVAPAELVTNLE